MDTITDRTMFSSAEACALAGVSYRQLDYWCRIGTIEPGTPAKGSGSRRRWSRQQVAVLAVLALVGGHVLVGRLGELTAVLLDWDMTTWDGTTLLVDSAGSVWLADEPGAPPVTTAINLAAVADQVHLRAAELQA